MSKLCEWITWGIPEKKGSAGVCPNQGKFNSAYVHHVKLVWVRLQEKLNFRYNF